MVAIPLLRHCRSCEQSIPDSSLWLWHCCHSFHLSIYYNHPVYCSYYFEQVSIHSLLWRKSNKILFTYLSEKVLFLLDFWRIILLNTKFYDGDAFLPHLNISLYSCLHGFWWGFQCNHFPCSSIGKVLFFAFFQDFLFVFSFLQFNLWP